VQNQQVVVVRRDTREKIPVAFDDLAETVARLLNDIQDAMLEAARERLGEKTVVVNTLDELYERVQSNAGFSLAGWCGDAACEDQVKAASKATIRCLPLEQPNDPGTCIVCGAAATAQVVFARAY
jgi:prolyl-tRNA synthetase